MPLDDAQDDQEEREEERQEERRSTIRFVLLCVGVAAVAVLTVALVSVYNSSSPTTTTSTQPAGNTTQQSQVTPQEAYQNGFAHGETSSAGFISGGPSEETVCRISGAPYSYSAGLDADWQNGCIAGFQKGQQGPA